MIRNTLLFHLMPLLAAILVCFFPAESYGAADMTLQSLAYENPAELNRIKNYEYIVGLDYINLKVTFKGTASGETGTARSNPHDLLWYGQIGKRINDKFVAAIALTRPDYVHLAWGKNSIVRFTSTATETNAWRLSTRFSYQLTKTLAFGFAFDVDRLYNYELSFVDINNPDRGEIKNVAQSPLYLGYDVGIFWSICPKTHLSVCLYSGRTEPHSFGHSKSDSGLSNSSYASNSPEPLIVYARLYQNISDNLLVAFRAIWSQWQVAETVPFLNTVAGPITFEIPTRWKNVWSYDALAVYKFWDKWSFILAGEYIPDISRRDLNTVAYPLGNILNFGAGFSREICKGLVGQLIYVHGIFTPKAKIDTGIDEGRVTLHNNYVGAKLTWAW